MYFTYYLWCMDLDDLATNEFEADEIGVCAPLGFFDPLGFAPKNKRHGMAWDGNGQGDGTEV